MGHTIMLYSLMFTLAGLAIALYGKRYTHYRDCIESTVKSNR